MDEKEHLHARVTINKQGRIVIPAPLRHALAIGPGDEIVVRVEGQQLVLETPAAILARIRARFASIPPEVDLVAELLQERREAARRENAELGLD
jgi:AbrB family looped-hinge helix DNA binding protein